MPIDKIESTVIELPYDHEAIVSGDRERLASYIRELIDSLEAVQARIIQVANLVLDLGAGGAYYYDLPDDNGVYPEGTWRTLQIGNDLVDQRIESNVWTNQGVREPRKI